MIFIDSVDHVQPCLYVLVLLQVAVEVIFILCFHHAVFRSVYEPLEVRKVNEWRLSYF